MAQNHLLLKAEYGNPEMHSHSACHLLVSLQGNICVITEKETVTCRGAILPSGVSHTVESFGEPLLVFLFDITTTAAEQMEHFAALEEQTAESIAFSYGALASGNLTEDYGKFFVKVMECIGIHKVCSRVSDERITAAMHFVKAHLREDLTVGDAAESVCLSEGRFSHLFREETGIAFSRYLVMQKVFRAYMQIAEGASITEASLAAGFSTPSHFATVNKRLFGITASDLRGGYRLHRIADI